ncbi:17455_t:CDS:1, partial [Funneliformis geosporum]
MVINRNLENALKDMETRHTQELQAIRQKIKVLELNHFVELIDLSSRVKALEKKVREL